VKTLPLLALLFASSLVAACGEDEPSPDAESGAGAATPASAPYLLAQDIPGTVPVLTALAGAEGAEIAVVGKLQRKVKGRAIFYLTDEKVEDCTRTGDDGCPTPWDYCCREKEMLKSTILVELRGPDGQPAPVASLGIRELDLVAVRGTLAKTESGRVILLAKDGWYRRDRPKASPHWKFPD
jgi:hypothetical protein